MSEDVGGLQAAVLEGLADVEHLVAWAEREHGAAGRQEVLAAMAEIVGRLSQP